MIVKHEDGEYELFCDECGLSLEDDDEVYDVDEQVLCIFCLRMKFKRKG